MNSRILINNFLAAAFAQGFSFVVSAVSSFVLPRVLPVEDYGYWQLFLFYVGYIGFLQFGLNDGLYLRFGGQTRTTIDSKSITAQFVSSIVSQLLIAVIVLVLYSGGVSSEDRLFVGVAVSVMIPVCNCGWYLGYLLQALNETRSYSESLFISRAIFFVPLIILLSMKQSDYRLYVVFYIVGQTACLIYCIVKSRKVLKWQNSIQSVNYILSETALSVKVGIKLLIATLASTLMVGCSRFAIDAVWGIESFGMISLSMSIVNFFLTMMAQLSMVLFPAIRQADSKVHKNIFEKIRSITYCIMPIAYFLYFCISAVLVWWLPDYYVAIALAAILMPICVYDGIFQVTQLTYYKVARKESQLLVINLAFLAISVVLTFSAVMLKDIELVLAAPTLAITSRAVLTDWAMCKSFGIAQHNCSVLCMALTLEFLCLIMLNTNSFTSMIIYACSYGLVLFCTRKELLSFAKAIKKD